MVLIFNCFSGPLFALMQRLVPDNRRATALAVVLLLGNLIGQGIGPQVVGVISDALAPSLGADSLRYAMLSMTVTAVGASFFFWRASRTVAQDLEDVRGVEQHSQVACHAAVG